MQNSIKTVCFILLTIAAILFLYRIDQSQQKLTLNLSTLTSGLTSTNSQLSTTLTKLNSAADQDTRYYQQAAEQLPKTEREIRDLLVHSDKNLNDPFTGTFSLLNQSITQLSLDSHTALTGIDNVTIAAQSTLESGTHSLDLLSERIGDPKLDDILTHIDLASLHLDQATDNANGAIGNVNKITAYYDERLTSPKGFVSTLGRGLFSLIVPGADVYTAYRAGTASAAIASSAIIKKVKSKGNLQ
jgi:hypothetical protein